VSPWLPLAAGLAGVLCVVAGALIVWQRARDDRLGEMVAVDLDRATTLRSPRYRLAGRPDLLRRRRDGSVVPIELKHRSAPRFGPFRSHRVQVGAYCLLVEATTGRAPPFGVLRYRDREVVVPWTPTLRAEVLGLLAEVGEPYRGQADPSPEKCAGCVWSDRCDASMAPAGRGPRRVHRTG